jgi:hypothetical protein
VKKVVPWIWGPFTNLSPRRGGFDPRPIIVAFVVDKVALGQIFLLIPRFVSSRYHSTNTSHLFVFPYLSECLRRYNTHFQTKRPEVWDAAVYCKRHLKSNTVRALRYIGVLLLVVIPRKAIARDEARSQTNLRWHLHISVIHKRERGVRSCLCWWCVVCLCSYAC